MSGPWTGPTPRGSQHPHFSESTFYKTCFRLEVEPVHRMVLLSQRRTPEVPDQIRAVFLAARVGAMAVSLHPQKVYVAAIAAKHDPVEGKSVGKHDWVIRYLMGGQEG